VAFLHSNTFHLSILATELSTSVKKSLSCFSTNFRRHLPVLHGQFILTFAGIMSHEATAGHELTDIPSVATPFRTNIPLNERRQQGVYAQLLDNENRANAKRSERTWPRFRDSLRSFRLQFVSLIFGYLSSWTSNTEYRKVAMYRSRRMAASHSLLHLVPLSGAITGLTLQWSKYWVGTETDKTTILQFVAKFHELTMQASLTEVLLCVIRTMAVNGYVPLGALSGATQPTQLSYLWSLDYISNFTSSALHRWRRAVLVLIIPFILILTSLVGPSTAILMIPRPNTPHIVGQETMYSSNSTEDLFPSLLTPDKGLEVSVFTSESSSPRHQLIYCVGTFRGIMLPYRALGKPWCYSLTIPSTPTGITLSYSYTM
jgi:hypothetical protein